MYTKHITNNLMKELKITIKLPEDFGGVTVKTIIEQSGETTSSNMVILAPSSNNGEVLEPSNIEIKYEGETLISSSFKTPEVKTST